MKSLIRSLINLASFGLLAKPSKGKPKAAIPLSAPAEDGRGQSLTVDDLRSLFNGYSVLHDSRGTNGMIAIRRAARTTNQRKRRKDYRRKIAAGMV